MTMPVDNAAAILTRDLLDQLARPIPEAARLAYRHGGPSLAELEQHITALHRRFGR